MHWHLLWINLGTIKNIKMQNVKNQTTTNTKEEVNYYTPISSNNNALNNMSAKYGIVVPCYNEEKRFPYQHFLAFTKANEDVIICFVNDGSKDKTMSVLRGIQVEQPSNICVYSLKQNSGKSEAVRQGMLYMHKTFSVAQIGFLDADLATLPEEWLEMAKYKEKFPQFGAIVGSRIQRLGANIRRNDNRSLLSSIVKKFIHVILKTPFQDTQCGAKIFQRNLVPFLFNEKFLTPWLFDVEIFLKLQKKFGKTTLQKGVLEFPLMHWTEVGDSRLKLKDSIKIPMQLLKLFLQYNFNNNKKSNEKIFSINKKSNLVFFNNLTRKIAI